MEFYYDLLSQPCRALYLFFKAAGVDFEPKPLELTKGEHHSPEFVKKNPYHKVPIIDDKGFILAESVAIMRYVAVKNNVAEHWYPRADVQKQARVDEFLHWQHLCLRQPCIGVFINVFRAKIGFGRLTKRPTDQEKLKADKEEVSKTVAHIADYFLQDRQYIGGDEVSVADLIALMELVQLDVIGLEDLYLSNAKVKSWAERVANRMQSHYDETMAKIRNLKEVYNNTKE